MTCIYIHYTATVVMAKLFFWPKYPFKVIGAMQLPIICMACWLMPLQYR